jgi:hypothetical protein
MIDYEGFRNDGKFTLDNGVEVQGELSLKGSATSLSLHADAHFELQNNSDISGVFYDGGKVSLIKCIGIVNSGRSRTFANVFPHFVLFGQQHISSSVETIHRISFTVDDAHDLFYDTSTFGQISFDTHAKLERLLEGEKPKRKIELGSHPCIFYYTDKFEIISIDTAFGNISANNYATPRSLFNKGIRVDNTIKIDIEFKSKVTIGEAIGTVYDLLLFIEIIAGRSQNVSQLRCFSMNTHEDRDHFFDVYLCNARNHEINSQHRPSPSDLPIQAVDKPDEFSCVLKYWAEQHEERRFARMCFSEAFAHQHRYTTARIVGAANMFDILPQSAFPPPAALSTDLEEARCNARNIFKSLPVSLKRDSILGALGRKRMEQAVLKMKVKHRANLTTDIVGEYFPEIELVIYQAVDLRNYYVHGTKKNNIDYSKISGQVMFFTDTLEFVFAASELVEAGWDIAAWIESRPGYSHPFGRYLASYSERLEALKKLLAEKV